MSASSARAPEGAGGATTGLLAGVLVVLGLLGGLPLLLGPVVGVGGVVVAVAVRRNRTARRWGLEAVPVFGVLLVLGLSAPAERSAELFAGLAALAALLWLADDRQRAPGRWTRAVPTLGLAALGFGLAWALTLLLPSGTQNVGAAGVLLVAALVLVSVVLAVAVLRPRPETA